MTEAKDVVHAYHRAVTSRDVGAMKSTLAPNVTYTTQGQTQTGVEAMARSLEATVAAFPDLAYEFPTVVAEGDTVAVDGVFRGTHTGPLTTSAEPVPPTNKRAEFVFPTFMKVSGDRIVSITSYHDPMDLIADLATPVQAQMPGQQPLGGMQT